MPIVNKKRKSLSRKRKSLRGGGIPFLSLKAVTNVFQKKINVKKQEAEVAVQETSKADEIEQNKLRREASLQRRKTAAKVKSIIKK